MRNRRSTGSPKARVVHHGRERLRDTAEEGRELVLEAAAAAKPKLRGWLHVGIFPLSVAAGVVLIVLSPTTVSRVGSAVFAVTAVLLFGASGLLHRGRWSPSVEQALRRLDHASIFLLIAGTYTPFTLVLLDGTDERILLGLVWSGALAGVAFRVLWVGAPRWLYTPVYIALGWAAAFWMDDFLAAGSVPVVVLICSGGALYSLGGLVYGLRRPNPAPRWFGFHEIFHALTIAAFVAHYVGVSIATYSLA